MKMKKNTTSLMLFAALAFGFNACQNEKKKAEETSTEATHSVNDGHDHAAKSKDAHEYDTLSQMNHEGHDHAAGDTTHSHSDGHKH